MKEELEELFAYMDAPDIKIELPSGVSEERIIHRVMEQIRPASQRKRTKPRFLVIAIAAALALSITAGAVYHWAHSRESNLLKKTPIVSGSESTVEISEQNLQAIEENITDYQMKQASDQALVMLDSAMGFHSPDYSVAYLTVTVKPAPAEHAELEPNNCHFRRVRLQPQNPSTFLAGDLDSSTIQNEDGSVSMMYAFQFRYQDVTDVPVLLELTDFISDEYRLEGSWRFPIDHLQLSALTSSNPHPELFADKVLTPTALHLSAFGGKITLRGYYHLVETRFQSTVKEKYGDLPLEWDALFPDYGLIQQMCADGLLTQAQADDVWRIAEENDSSIHIGIEYADGTQDWDVKTLSAIPQFLIDAQRGLLGAEKMTQIGQAGHQYYLEHDEVMIPFVFYAPQELSGMKYLIVEDVKIPLQEEERGNE